MENSVVMVVVSKPKRQETNVPSVDQAIPRNVNTGLGSSEPIGFGNYSMINNPQYMSAISSVTDN